MKKIFGILAVALVGFFSMLANSYASFMGDIAETIGSWATDEVAVVIDWPIGSIIFYVLAIFLIGFVVSTIVMWVRSKK